MGKTALKPGKQLLEELMIFAGQHKPAKLSKLLRGLLLEHLLQYNGACLLNDEHIHGLAALFDFLDAAHKQRKKWKKKKH